MIICQFEKTKIGKLSILFQKKLANCQFSFLVTIDQFIIFPFCFLINNVNQMDNSFSVILILNSLLLIAFILNQNESNKDTGTTSSSAPNPLEQLTWVGFLFQFVLLLIQIKLTDI